MDERQDLVPVNQESELMARQGRGDVGRRYVVIKAVQVGGQTVEAAPGVPRPDERQVADDGEYEPPNGQPGQTRTPGEQGARGWARNATARSTWALASGVGVGVGAMVGIWACLVASGRLGLVFGVPHPFSLAW